VLCQINDNTMDCTRKYTHAQRTLPLNPNPKTPSTLIPKQDIINDNTMDYTHKHTHSHKTLYSKP